MYQVLKRDCKVVRGRIDNEGPDKLFSANEIGDTICVIAQLDGPYGPLQVEGYFGAELLRWQKDRMWMHILCEMNECAANKVGEKAMEAMQ